MRSNPVALMLLLAATSLWSAEAAGQEPLIDAGRQAMIMHYNNLLEQQTAPNNDDTAKRRAGSKRDQQSASLGCSIAEEREKLRPEYERRVRADGQQAANAWLREEAAALGRQAAERAKAGEPC